MKNKTKSFRLDEQTVKNLKELATLWGVSETRAIERMIDTFYAVRVDLGVIKNG